MFEFVARTSSQNVILEKDFARARVLPEKTVAHIPNTEAME
jgi:hypothetical protein